MTLKEKFSELLPFYNVNDNNNKSIQCEKIADEFAIEFANWVQFHSELWIKYRTSELLEIFKKEKGL